MFWAANPQNSKIWQSIKIETKNSIIQITTFEKPHYTKAIMQPRVVNIAHCTKNPVYSLCIPRLRYGFCAILASAMHRLNVLPDIPVKRIPAMPSHSIPATHVGMLHTFPKLTVCQKPIPFIKYDFHCKNCLQFYGQVKQVPDEIPKITASYGLLRFSVVIYRNLHMP